MRNSGHKRVVVVVVNLDEIANSIRSERWRTSEKM